MVENRQFFSSRRIVVRPIVVRPVVAVPNRILEMVSYYRYLGLIVSSWLSWSPVKKNLAPQAEKAVHLIKNILINKMAPIKLKLGVFDRMIAPILCYGAETIS